MTDYGREQSDKKLKRLENRIKKEYAQASKEAQKKLDNYLSKFEEDDAFMRGRLASKEITEKQYDEWRSDRLMATNEWQFTVDSLNKTFENARTVAAEMMDGHVKEIYAFNHNFAAYEIEKELKANLSFNLYDADTVTRLMLDNPKMLPNPGKKVAEDIKAGKLKRWNNRHIQSAMLQSILQGESLPMIAKRVSRTVGGMDERVAIRSARTMTTTAESAGRVDRYKEAQDMGIEMKQMWIATLDLHTRSSHRHLDGERILVGETFSNGLRYPGDLNGSPEEVYNCRCTIGAVIPGTDLDRLGIEGVQRNSRLGDMSYEEWKRERDKSPEDTGHKVVDGKDVSDTWERRSDLFDFEIEDIINAQGFDGLPLILDDEDAFAEAVRAANGGNGFIAQRTYSAPSQDILDAYREQLYGGRWYVDCGTGGAQYGQGMYCAADYSGVLSDGIRREMEHYIDLGQQRFSKRLSGMSDEEIRGVLPEVIKDVFPNMSKSQIRDAVDYLTYDRYDWSREIVTTSRAIEARNALIEAGINPAEVGYYVEIYKWDAVNYVETFTLHPSAKIVSYNKLFEEYQKYITMVRSTETEDRAKAKAIEYVANLMGGTAQEKYDYKVMLSDYMGKRMYMGLGSKEAAKALRIAYGWNDDSSKLREMALKVRSNMDKFMPKEFYDIGSFAVARGYDAIDASGHGASGSYTVILNRTKVIIKRSK